MTDNAVRDDKPVRTSPVTFYRQVVAELRKVVWPTQDQLVTYFSVVMVFVLVVIFTFFYTLVVFNQQNLAEGLQRNGGFVLGIRPGRPTQEYLNKVIVRITMGGALFLGFISIVPYIASLVTGVQAISLSSTSLLIMVGVGLDTLRQLEAQLMMRNYEGFLR